jgi:hypothetical protein
MGIAFSTGSAVGVAVGDCSGSGLEGWPISECVNTSKRRASLAKTMVKAIKIMVKAIKAMAK